MPDSYTYLTAEELSDRIKYDCRTIRQQLKDSALIEGIHYIKPFGRRKILYLREAIEIEILGSRSSSLAIPMSGGGVCHG